MRFKQFISDCFDLSNPGGKIKKVAKAIYMIEVFLTTIAAYIIILSSDVFPILVSLFIIGPVTAIAAFFLSWVIFWPQAILTYGFGELIENTGHELFKKRKYTENANCEVEGRSTHTNEKKTSDQIYNDRYSHIFDQPDEIIGTCDYCLRQKTPVFKYVIEDNDSIQTRYLCKKCFENQNTKK